MGYSVYYSKTNARFQGYGVPAYCDHPECMVRIDRGMGYACCNDPTHQNSCGGFYCSEHRELCVIDLSEDEENYPDEYSYICKHEPIEAKEHSEWINHMTNDKSWNEWRNENTKEFERMKSLVKAEQ